VLDGFPRTTAQADMLETLAAAQGHELVAILVDVPFEILERRVTGRRNCPVCGEIYNVYLKPPKFDEVCDLHPEVKLNRRADDNAETIKERLAAYEKDTQPLLDYYGKTGRLRRVDGMRDTEEIYADVEKIVNGQQ
jgi:adenylate kinase